MKYFVAGQNITERKIHVDFTNKDTMTLVIPTRTFDLIRYVDAWGDLHGNVIDLNWKNDNGEISATSWYLLLQNFSSYNEDLAESRVFIVPHLITSIVRDFDKQYHTKETKDLVERIESGNYTSAERNDVKRMSCEMEDEDMWLVYCILSKYYNKQ